MAAETAVSEKDPGTIQRHFGETRTSLVDKVETLEEGINGMLRGANEAVTETVEGVRGMVGVTAQAMQSAVHDTTGAVGRALDVPAHVRRHPWLMVGGALLLGIMVGALMSRGRW
jgi:ElaB/YqjD/DUF883 family membrane-anchored ribosome-binding protein